MVSRISIARSKSRAFDATRMSALSFSISSGMSLSLMSAPFFALPVMERVDCTSLTIVKEVQSTLSITGKAKKGADIKLKDIPEEIEKLKALMRVASNALDFERAIEIRETINDLRKRMRK